MSLLSRLKEKQGKPDDDNNQNASKAQAPEKAPAKPSIKPKAKPGGLARMAPSGGEALGEDEDPKMRLKSRIHQEIIERLDFSKLTNLDEQAVQESIKPVIQQLLYEAKIPMTGDERALLMEEIQDEILGLGPIQPLINDDSYSEIMVNGPDQVYTEKDGRLVLTAVKFKDNDHLNQIINRIVTAVGRRIDESSPICDARLKDGSRVNAIIPPLALDGSALTIRKFGKSALTSDDLIKYGAATPEIIKTLRACVQGRLNIIISGGTGSGKTTLLNMCSGFIPRGERIVTCEDAAELRLQQDHVVRLETRPPNVEGKGEVTMRDLVKNCLRMRPDRVVIGECRGGEALDMLQAMNTGHDGSLTTLHANAPREALMRLETLIMMAGTELPIVAMRQQIASAVDLIVQTQRLADGSRKIIDVTEVVGMEQDIITIQDIFEFKQEGREDSGKVIGSHRSKGIRPKFMDKLKEEGINLDEDMFVY